eukprot:TRINITY_DN33774_c0_g1_i1.p1 TRINITY_DN33774_c0_g1~~TRINITY_DN33774_c0_g1_i1.p1  ORF type:complete len:224 (+),score=49.81 TRINITY_DN33774_c0_g1_i1:37-672(+)
MALEDKLIFVQVPGQHQRGLTFVFWMKIVVAILLGVGLVFVSSRAFGDKKNHHLPHLRSKITSPAEFDAVNADDLQVVMRMYSYWGAGKLNGPHCVTAAADLALEDVVYDASSDAMPHIEGAKIYHGLHGFCEFSAWLQTFKQPDYKLVETLHSGTGTVLLKESLTPTVISTGKTLGHAMENVVEFKAKDNKIASMKVFWGEPKAFDQLWS